MANWVDYVRGVFHRDAAARDQAAAGVPTGDIPGDAYGNLGVNSASRGLSQDYLTLSDALMARFVDYERMDSYPDCASALTIYADDATTIDSSKDHVMWVECKDETVRRSLNDMLHKKINIDDEIWEMAHVLVKMGNDHEEILVGPEGVVGLNFLPAPSVRRIEDENGTLKAFIQSFKGNWAVQAPQVDKIKFDRGVGKDARTGIVVFEPWRCIHMRLRSTRRRAMYGASILEPARWVWRRLILLEDSAMISRLSRAPSRFAFYVDVGKLPKNKAEKYMNQIRQQMKKKKFLDPRTGKLDLRYAPHSTVEDFFLPVRGGNEVVRADVLNTPQWTGVEDIEYFRNKLHAALMVPRAYLGYDENSPSRATLSGEDARFGKSVLRIQKELRAGMNQVCKVHLAATGVDPAYVDFKIKMTVPSQIFELAQLEVQNTRAQLAQSMQEMVSKQWMLSTIFGLTDTEIEKIFVQKQEEMKADIAAQGGGQFEGQLPVPGSHAHKMLLAGQGRTRGSLEKDLFEHHNPAAQRRMEDKLDVILHRDQRLASQIHHMQGFLQELRSAVKGGR